MAFCTLPANDRPSTALDPTPSSIAYLSFHACNAAHLSLSLPQAGSSSSLDLIEIPHATQPEPPPPSRLQLPPNPLAIAARWPLVVVCNPDGIHVLRISATPTAADSPAATSLTNFEAAAEPPTVLTYALSAVALVPYPPFLLDEIEAIVAEHAHSRHATHKGSAAAGSPAKGSAKANARASKGGKGGLPPPPLLTETSECGTHVLLAVGFSVCRVPLVPAAAADRLSQTLQAIMPSPRVITSPQRLRAISAHPSAASAAPAPPLLLDTSRLRSVVRGLLSDRDESPIGPHAHHLLRRLRLQLRHSVQSLRVVEASGNVYVDVEEAAADALQHAVGRVHNLSRTASRALWAVLKSAILPPSGGPAGEGEDGAAGDCAGDGAGGDDADGQWEAERWEREATLWSLVSDEVEQVCFPSLLGPLLKIYATQQRTADEAWCMKREELQGQHLASPAEDVDASVGLTPVIFGLPSALCDLAPPPPGQAAEDDVATEKEALKETVKAAGQETVKEAGQETVKEAGQETVKAAGQETVKEVEQETVKEVEQEEVKEKVDQEASSPLVVESRPLETIAHPLMLTPADPPAPAAVAAEEEEFSEKEFSEEEEEEWEEEEEEEAGVEDQLDYSRMPYSSAVRLLRGIADLRTPTRKARRLVEVLQAVERTARASVQRHAAMSGTCCREHSVSADDLAPLCAYVALQSSPPRLLATLHLLQEFLPDDVATGQEVRS